MNPYNPFEIEPNPTDVPSEHNSNRYNKMQVLLCILGALLIVCFTTGSIAFRIVDGNVRMAQAKYNVTNVVHASPTTSPASHPINATATTQNLCVGAQLDVPDPLIGYNTYASGIITAITEDRTMVQTINKGGERLWHPTYELGIYSSERGAAIPASGLPVISGWCR